MDASGVFGANVIGEICWFAFSDVPKNFLICNGAQPLRTSYPTLASKLVKASPVTFPAVTSGNIYVSWPGNTISLYDPVKFSGTVPSGLTANTNYYAVNVTSAGFNLVTNPAAPVVITGTIASSISSTAINAPWGDGNGSTTFTLPNLLNMFVRGWNPALGRVFGSFQAQDVGPHNHYVQAGRRRGADGDVYGACWDGGNVGLPGVDGVYSFNNSGVETRPDNIALIPCIAAQ